MHTTLEVAQTVTISHQQYAKLTPVQQSVSSRRCLTLFHAKTQNKEIQAQDTVETQTVEGSENDKWQARQEPHQDGKKTSCMKHAVPRCRRQSLTNQSVSATEHMFELFL